VINLDPVEHITVSEKIAEQIIELVTTGRLRPGDRLPSERDLMEQLHVSRSPIREALRSLSLVGLLETRPGDGTYVSERIHGALAVQLASPLMLGRPDVLEWREVREPLEEQAAGLAAARATPEGVARLEAILAQMSAAGNDPESSSEADIAFHEAIGALSRNVTLQQLLRLCHDVYRGFLRDRRVHFVVGKVPEAGLREVVEAIKAGDAEAASRAMAAHLRVSKQEALVQELQGALGFVQR
jgi:GntR family transcriptional repressor for pyruvate dehydrogenase complex